jgi:hypothetical protein
MYSLVTPSQASADFDPRTTGSAANSAFLLAPLDRARRWNDLEASWSFYLQGSEVSNQ